MSRDPWDDDDRPTLESCWCGEHRECPDGWHPEPSDPTSSWCGCTADCALDDADVR